MSKMELVVAAVMAALFASGQIATEAVPAPPPPSAVKAEQQREGKPVEFQTVTYRPAGKASARPIVSLQKKIAARKSARKYQSRYNSTKVVPVTKVYTIKKRGGGSISLYQVGKITDSDTRYYRVETSK